MKRTHEKETIADNKCGNNLRLFDVLTNFPFTTTKAIGNYFL